MRMRPWIFLSAMNLLATAPCGAMIFLDTGDLSHNTTTPGDNSGWQYEGSFNTELGVPIAPFFFLGAKHLTANTIGHSLIFHGESYETIDKHDIPGTDLRVWEVDHTKPFPNYAPLSSGTADVGSTATVIGRGKNRGAAIMLGPTLKGWAHGYTDNVQRWGRNIVTASYYDGIDFGELLYCDFDSPGIAEECQLATGDSGGGMFVLENGLWRLAGIVLAVDGPFRALPSVPANGAALTDCGGFEIRISTGPEVWAPITDTPADKPSSFYCSRVSAYIPQILAITGGDGSLAAENFAAWQTLYFTPTEIGVPATTGPQGDYDGDGINNLLEFALNLDPSFDERATMTPSTGLRGLPICQVENISGSDYLTIEFVRRKPSNGGNLTYIQEFSDDLETWTQLGTEVSASLNDRWERVKFTDTVTTLGAQKRFVRLRVVLSP